MSQYKHSRTAVISAASSGDNTIIAANSTRAININKIWFTTAGAVNVIFLAGATALSGTEVFSGNGANFYLKDDDPWLYIPPNTAFIINLSGAVALGGMVYYEWV